MNALVSPRSSVNYGQSPVAAQFNAGYSQMGAQPVYTQPAYGQPAVQQPVYAAPPVGYGQPAYGADPYSQGFEQPFVEEVPPAEVLNLAGYVDPNAVVATPVATAPATAAMSAAAVRAQQREMAIKKQQDRLRKMEEKKNSNPRLQAYQKQKQTGPSNSNSVIYLLAAKFSQTFAYLMFYFLFIGGRATGNSRKYILRFAIFLFFRLTRHSSNITLSFC